MCGRLPMALNTRGGTGLRDDGLGLVWFGLVWFGLVWFGLVWFTQPLSLPVCLAIYLSSSSYGENTRKTDKQIR